MKIFFLILLIHLSTYGNDLAKNETCVCEKVNCNPCEKQNGLDFYTAKCNFGKSTKSCSKPKCEPLDELPKECLNDSKIEDKSAPIEVVQIKKSVLESIGVILVKVGHVQSKLGTTEPKEVKVGEKVYEGQTFNSDKESRLKILLHDQNTLFLYPNSSLTLEKQKFNAENNLKQTELLMNYGKLRSKVNQVYDKTTNHFKVRTKSAVAGVRGTNFIISYYEDKGLSKVQTLEGKVLLSSKETGKGVEIPAEFTGSFIITQENEPVFTDVVKLKDSEKAEINHQINIFANASEVFEKQDPMICSSPNAKFNDCLWECKNNPQNEEKCRTDLTQVQCLRKRCNANGEWAESFRYPASSSPCTSNESMVKKCDY